MHILLPYDPQLHLKTTRISVHQPVYSPKPISDLTNALVLLVRPTRVTLGRELAYMQLPVQLCELPVRQLLHQRSYTRRGERVTWLRCSGRSSGFELVQSHICLDSSTQWHGLPGVVVNNCVMWAGTNGA